MYTGHFNLKARKLYIKICIEKKEKTTCLEYLYTNDSKSSNTSQCQKKQIERVVSKHAYSFIKVKYIS